VDEVVILRGCATFSVISAVPQGVSLYLTTESLSGFLRIEESLLLLLVTVEIWLLVSTTQGNSIYAQQPLLLSINMLPNE